MVQSNIAIDPAWITAREAADIIGRDICGIYRFTCKKTGRVYIGQAKDIAARILQHARGAKKADRNSTAWYRALAEAGGVSGFKVEVLEVLPRDRAILADRENYWLAFHQAGHSLNCFNTHPKTGVSPLGMSVNPVTVLRVKLALTGRPRPLEVIERIRATKLTPAGRARNSAANKGRKHTAETIAKYKAAQSTPEARARSSARHLGIPLAPSHISKMIAFQNQPEQKAKKAARMKGREVSQATRNQIAKKLIGVSHTPERRLHQSIARKAMLARCGCSWTGRKHSEETKAKMRASRRAYFAIIAQSTQPIEVSCPTNHS